MELQSIEKQLLKEVTQLESIPQGAFNIRLNGKLFAREKSANIEIQTKTDKPGIDIFVKNTAQGERVDIPVLLTQTGLSDLVYNDFFVESGADVVIVAGCAIHNVGHENTQHDGVHTFHIGKDAKVKYIERHLGNDNQNAQNIFNPTTVVEIDENGYMEMDTTQIRGVDKTLRTTKAKLGDNATLVINEKIMTDRSQDATTDFYVDLNGKNSGAHVVSRAVAKDNSHQKFVSCINGNNLCNGHTECDAIIMDNANISAVPKINANHVESTLVHEAAIGKIAGDQLVKLMALGLDQKQAEQQIINGFLK